MEFAVTALRADDSCRSTACRSTALIGVAMVPPDLEICGSPIRAHCRALGRIFASGAAVRPANAKRPSSTSNRVDDDLRLDARWPVAGHGAPRHAGPGVL